MGVILTRIKHALGLLSLNQEYRVLILGLDNAGKTSILYRLQLGNIISTIPTVGFNLETLQYKNITFNLWDLGGQTSIRPYWRCYFTETNAIVYVVDSTDRDRMGLSKQELIALLEEDELKNSVLLVFANKQDLPGAASETEITELLGLNWVQNRTWTIIKSSVVDGTGLTEGMDWLCDQLESA